jgi:phosphate-selective porin OprO and OprP
MRYLFVALLFCEPLLADNSSIEERLTKLEAEVQQLRSENNELRTALGLQTIKSNPSPDVKAAGPERRLQLGGILQVQAEAGGALDTRYTDNNPRIFLRRARLTASGLFAEHFDFRTQIDMTGAIGGASGLRAQLTDAYVTWLPSPHFDVRAGQFKTPFGFEQLYPDPALYTPERTVGSDRLTLGRQIGVEAFGAFHDGFEYSVGAFNGNGTNVSANDNKRFLYIGRVAGRVWKGEIGSFSTRISAGVNGFTSNDTALAMAPEFGFRSNSFTGERRGIGADVQSVFGPFEIWTEWLRDRFAPQSRVPFGSFNARAASIVGVYKYAKFQFIARYDSYDPDSRLQTGESTRTSDGGVNYLLRGEELKLQVHFLRSKTGDTTHTRAIARIQTVF